MSRNLPGTWMQGDWPSRRYSDVIHVNADDISQGKRNNCEKCPLALAILRKHPTATGVQVTNPFVFVHFKKRTNRYVIDQETWNFVYFFDHKASVKPATFKLALDFVF